MPHEPRPGSGRATAWYSFAQVRPAALWPTPCAVLLLLLAWAVPARADQCLVEVNPPVAGPGLDNRHLVDVICIHTRDVQAAEPGSGNRLRVFYDLARGKGGAVIVTMYVEAPGQPLVRVVVRGQVDDDLYRALALKVRAALLGDPSLVRVTSRPSRVTQAPPAAASPGPAAAPTPAPAPPPSVTPSGANAPSGPSSPPRKEPTPPRPAPPRVAPPAAVAVAPRPAPAVAAPPTTSSTPPVAFDASWPGQNGPFSTSLVRELRRTRPLALTVELAGRAVLSDGAATARAGGVAGVALAFGSIYELALSAAWDQGLDQVDAKDARRRTTAEVVPVVASLRLLHRGNRWTLGAGPRLGVAIVHASATGSGGDLGSLSSAAALLGGETQARFRLWKTLQIVGGMTVDLVLPAPRLRIVVRDTQEVLQAVEVGQVAATAFLGVAYTIP